MYRIAVCFLWYDIAPGGVTPLSDCPAALWASLRTASPPFFLSLQTGLLRGQQHVDT